MKKVLFTVFDNFEEIELISPLDILKRANIAYDVCSFNNQKFVKSNHVKVVVTIENINLNDYDAILIHGGSGVQEMRSNQKFIELVRHFKKNDKSIYAICDAPNFLFENKIITTEKYTSYPIQNIQAGANRITNQPVVAVDKLITALGPGSAFEFSLKIVEIRVGKKIAETLKNGMKF